MGGRSLPKLKSDTVVSGLRVAFTGHRWNRLAPAFEPQLKLELSAVFYKIEFWAKKRLAPGHGLQITLVSGLAEGADQIGAEAIPAHWNLEALLAMPRSRFHKHLDENGTGDAAERMRTLLRLTKLLVRANTTLVELPETDGKGDPSSPFVVLRDQLVTTCTILVAVWDGKAPGRSPGGTADVVEAARQRGLEVIIVACPS